MRVALPVSAWIETKNTKTTKMEIYVALPVSAWIETRRLLGIG